VVGILTINAASEYCDNCSNGVCLDAASTRRRGAEDVGRKPVSLGLGALGTGVGIYLFASSAPARAAAPRSVVTPLFSPSFGGLSLMRRF